MKHPTLAVAAVTCTLFCLSLGVALTQVTDPITNAGSVRSDNVLFAHAQKAMANSDYSEARTLLGTLVNEHPDSDYVPRAKLSIADAWFSEGKFKKAEVEYKDFITFFPDRPEVMKAQSRINFIHRQSN